MNQEIIKTAIEAYATANWSGDATLHFENKAVKEKASDSWVRLIVMDAGTQRETLTGDPATGQREYGLVMCSIFTPANQGSEKSKQLKDALHALFYGKNIGSGIRFEDKSNPSPGEDDVWFQENISFPFERDTL